MSRLTVARRYAQALFELADDQNLLEQVEKDLHLIIKTLQEHEELALLVDNQLVDSADKFQVVLKIFGQELQTLTLDFLGIIFEKHREHYLSAIYEEFLINTDQKKGIMEVEVRTAVELEPEASRQLQQKLAEATGKKLRIRYQVHPDLVGGALIKIGDKVIDGSITAKLKNLQKQLSS